MCGVRSVYAKLQVRPRAQNKKKRIEIACLDQPMKQIITRWRPGKDRRKVQRGQVNVRAIPNTTTG